MRTIVLVGCAAALSLAPLAAEAQQPTRRRQQTIEIRGQVPTPQVVTVRPREVPAYSRQVISPNFYDRNFWPSILPGYQLVPQRMITGAAPMDSTARDTTGGAMRDSTGAGAPPAGTTPSGMTLRPAPGTPTPNLQTAPAARDSSGMRTPADTTRPARADSAGTPPAPGRR